MKKQIGKCAIAMATALTVLGSFVGCGGGSSGGNYDRSDSYYRNNDHNDDGYINDNEFQDAVGDYLDDRGY